MTIIRVKSVGKKAAFYVLEPTKYSELYETINRKMPFIFSPEFKSIIDDIFRC